MAPQHLQYILRKHTHTHTYTHTDIHTHTYTCIYVHACTYTQTRIFKCIYFPFHPLTLYYSINNHSLHLSLILFHFFRQNQNESHIPDLLRLLLRFGADCRIKDKDGNNGKFHI